MRTGFVLATLCALPSTVLAQDLPARAPPPVSSEAQAEIRSGERDPSAILREVPIVAYAYSASGVTAKTMGLQLYSLGLAASGQSNVLGGGGSVWGSPVDRLTIIADGQRNVSRDFSPSLAAIVRVYGDGHDGFAISGLGKFKIDGFGAGPEGDEVESELEIGLLVSWASTRWRIDANAIAGRGLGEDGEMDVEGRLRLGRDLSDWFRIGLDGQVRARVAGPLTLPNGRSWDFAAGPQMVAYRDNFFGSLTAGPTTMGLVSQNIGWTALVSVGGATF